MNQVIRPGYRSGSLTVPASKSAAHRTLICAALSDRKSEIRCAGLSRDILATMRCLSALGASFSEKENHILEVTPISSVPEGPRHMYCGESGSTLRFLLPVAAALGIPTVFHPEGRLAERPIAELASQLNQNGAAVETRDGLLYCSGNLSGGTYTVPGDISSQFISGLLLALPLVGEDSRLAITGRTESSSYIAMTEKVLKTAGITVKKNGSGYEIPGNQRCRMPAFSAIEGDWSGAAFFLCMGALSPAGVTVLGLDRNSRHGDRQMLQLLEAFGAEVVVSDDSVFVRKKEMHALTVDAAEIPDLVPVLSVLLAGANGRSEITNARRLRLKESDRLKSTTDLIVSLGGSAQETEDGLIINGTGNLRGGMVDVYNDHRIAMSAAAAASLCRENVTVMQAECTDKSYPSFWDDLNGLEVT